MMKKTNINPIVYNENEYGANQRGPYLAATADPEEYHHLCMIVKQHFPDKTQQQIDELLQRLRKEGCGYVAMINSLFDVYSSKADLFYKTFGFSMYDSDGTLNYNHVLVDLYCQKDNHNGGRFLFFTWDIYAENEDRIWSDSDKNGTFEWTEKPYGNNELQMKYRWESYCKEHNIRCKVMINKLVTPENFASYAEKGSVSILCSDFTVYNTDDKPTHIKGGHFMTITDITPDEKRYIVSSWGKKHYLNPKDIKGFRYYQVIAYKNIEES